VPTRSPRRPASNRLLDADDLAERWGFSRAAIYRLVRDQKVPAVKFGRHVRFSPAAIEAFEAKGGVERDAA
jgi:excisionase family DNA binding protein